MRDDVRALLAVDGVHPGRAARANIERACDLLAAGDEAKMVILGELSMFHEFVPVPERATGAFVLGERSLAAYGSTWSTQLSCAGTWDEISSMKVSGGLGGLCIDATVARVRMSFFEVYAGKRSDAHRRSLATLCSEKLRSDGR